MNKENKSGELDLDQLQDISGGSTIALPMPTGDVVYKCPACGKNFDASSRDMTVTCPNVKCRTSYRVQGGKLFVLPSTPLKSVL